MDLPDILKIMIFKDFLKDWKKKGPHPQYLYVPFWKPYVTLFPIYPFWGDRLPYSLPIPFREMRPVWRVPKPPCFVGRRLSALINRSINQSINRSINQKSRVEGAFRPLELPLKWAPRVLGPFTISATELRLIILVNTKNNLKIIKKQI